MSVWRLINRSFKSVARQHNGTIMTDLDKNLEWPTLGEALRGGFSDLNGRRKPFSHFAD